MTKSDDFNTFRNNLWGNGADIFFFLKFGD